MAVTMQQQMVVMMWNQELTSQGSFSKKLKLSYDTIMSLLGMCLHASEEIEIPCLYLYVSEEIENKIYMQY